MKDIKVITNWRGQNFHHFHLQQTLEEIGTFSRSVHLFYFGLLFGDNENQRNGPDIKWSKSIPHFGRNRICQRKVAQTYQYLSRLPMVPYFHSDNTRKFNQLDFGLEKYQS